ncbi:hypothetical protein ASE66_13710 [Bosea sp. Root483D1]|uniref:hypothetical protein n=1 Tax=Bosea sp. Root483D1 TaxID=1736544 RepID=UPI00070A1A6B|nr:hypothetical protein [Bosea sp. Root483D1]KRE14428.1 hypothetical protein ASE66_13710 [Bosea sp. Root483D1]
MNRITRIAACAGLAIATLPAQATEWIGRWGSPGCGADDTVIALGQQELDFSTFEASCRTLRAQRRRDVYEIAGQCHGEGRPMRVSFTVRVDGDTLSFIRQRGFDFSPKRFRRCR